MTLLTARWSGFEWIPQVKTQSSRQCKCMGLIWCIGKLSQGYLQLVVPWGRGLRQKLIAKLHCTALQGHFGVFKTVSALQARVYWPGMITMIKDFVKGCAVCQWVKDINALLQGELAPLLVPESYFNMWTMDFVTGLPLDGGLNRLMVCIEKLTKLTHLIPCFVGERALTAP